MADIRCSHCGNNNPDFLDVCQFCQSPLKSESMLHTGDIPSEKDTGELEPILPEWLQDARQQNRDSVGENSIDPDTRPNIQSSEPPDLLAGLASQSDSDDEEVPDWLASINPIEDKKSTLSSVIDNKEESSDFFAQFSKAESQQAPSMPSGLNLENENIPSLVDDTESEDAGQSDELTGWFAQSASEPSQPFALEQGGNDTAETSRMNDFDSSTPSEKDLPVEKESEDLSWLHDLENTSKQTGDLPPPQTDSGFDFAPTKSESLGEDLSWLNDLVGTPNAEEPVPAQSESSQDDLSWLDNLGGPSAPTIEESAPAQPESSQDDLSWLNNLGDTRSTPLEDSSFAQPESTDEGLSWLDNLSSTPSSTNEELTPLQPETSQEDLSWLDNIGGKPTPATEDPAFVQSEPSQDDLSWMKNLGEEENGQTPETPSGVFSPRGTAPLDGSAGYDSTPDWLKSAMEEPSMPAPGELSMDWFTEHDKPTGSEEPSETHEEPVFKVDSPDISTPQESTPVSPSESSTPSPQDVDEMFNIDMPDWISQDTGGLETSQSEFADSVSPGDSLAPVELPSWVQAMRPVDSAIEGTTDVEEREQEVESEGPLAGFLGVIPSAPIGSSLRPKAFSLKLQVTDEQQTGALLIEQILAGEMTARPATPTTVVASQRTLRWILSGLFIVVLSLVIGLGGQRFTIIPPGKVSLLSSSIESIPDGTPVLLVVDYEPAVAGELAAAAGPVLDQLALTRHSAFTFLSMSPNGPAMIEHLMLSSRLSRPITDGGLGYQEGTQYFNVGFLPGGSAGVLGFIDDPVNMMPDESSLANVGDFSHFGAVILLTDNSDSGRVWVEQLGFAKLAYPEIASQPFIIVSSAQAGPMLEPYASSGQVDVLVNGLSDAANYEYVNQSRPGIARVYWDSFGVGLMIAVLSVVLGNIWNIFMSIRERRAATEH